jgi:acyl-CoA thioesterase FadM
LFLQKKFLFLTDVYSAHVELDFKSSAVLGDVLICRARMCDVNLAGKTFLIEFEAERRIPFLCRLETVFVRFSRQMVVQ